MTFALNRVANLEDFQEPVVRDAIREIFAREASESPEFPTGREHRTQWENAMTVLAFRQGGALVPNAEVLGIGDGSEAARFWLTNYVGRVWAMDLYGKSGTSSHTVPSTLLVEPATAWGGPWNPRRLVIGHMNTSELLYEDETFDGIFVSRSIERLGSLEHVAAVIDEAFRVLKPGGTASFLTDLLIGGDPLQFGDEKVMFTPELIQRVLVGERDWALVAPVDYTISDATLATEVTVADYIAPTEPTDPHCVLRMGSNLITSVHIAVRRSARRPWRKVMPAGGEPLPISGPRPDVGSLADRLPDPVVAINVSHRGLPAYFGRRVLGERAKLIEFEPDPEGYHHHCARFAGQPNITIVPRALGSRRGSGSLPRKAELADEWKRLAQPVVPPDDVQDTAGAEVDTIDDWCRDHGIDGVDLLRLDVMGGALDVLHGGAAQLANAQAVEVQTWLNPVLTGVGVYSELDSLLREYGFVLWRLNEQTHYKLEGSEGALWSIERIAPSGHDPLELGVPSGPICRANVQYIRREIIAVGSQPSWTDCLRRAIVMNALCIHDAAWISLQRLLDDHPPRDVSADVWRIVGARPEVRAQPEVNAPRAVDHTEQAGDGEKSAPTDDQGAPNGQSEAAASPLASGPGLHHGRSLVELLASAARRPYHPVVWRLDRNYARGLERLDAIAARLDRLDAITARLGPIEARLAAVERRLQESSRRERDGLGASREAIRSAEQLMREVRLANDASREEIADWCAVIARELDRDRVDER